MAKKAAKEQVDMFPGKKPDVEISIIKSAIQKAYRRNHLELFDWAFNWLWELDPKWLIWRAPIFPAEEAWQNIRETGYVVRELETLTSTTNPMAMKKAKEILYAHLIESMGTQKNKDGDGIRIVAEMGAAMQPEEQEKMLTAIKKRVSADGYQSLLKMIEVEAFAAKARFVKPETWSEIWERVKSLGERGAELGKTADDYQLLRDQVGAAYFRAKKGGMVGDRTMLVAVALLSMDDYEFGTYGGLKNLPQTKHALVADGFKRTDKIPPWWTADMHTGVGKRVMGYVTVKYPYKKMAMQWMWFLEESALVNITHESSIWWTLACKVAYLHYGFKLEHIPALWDEIGGTIKDKTSEWILED